MNPQIAKVIADAEAGKVEAQYFLGSIYALGQFVPCDLKESVKWFERASAQGHAVSTLNLARLHAQGFGTPKDWAKALQLYRSAAELGLADAQFELATVLLNQEGPTRDPVEAGKWYRRAAEKNVAGAQLQLGCMLVQGLGMDVDAAEAAEWYAKAAAQGNARAQYSLGLMHLKGEGVLSDSKVATLWLRKSAEQGLVEAMCPLGVALCSGIALPEDRDEAAKWLHLAESKGDPNALEAMTALGIAYSKTREQEKRPDSVEAGRRWKRIAGPEMTGDQCPVSEVPQDGRVRSPAPTSAGDARPFFVRFPEAEKWHRAHAAFAQHYVPAYVRQNDWAFFHALMTGLDHNPPLDPTRFIRDRWRMFEQQLGYAPPGAAGDRGYPGVSDLRMAIYEVERSTCAVLAMPPRAGPGETIAYLVVVFPGLRGELDSWPRDAKAGFFIVPVEEGADFGLFLELQQDGFRRVVRPVVGKAVEAVLEATAATLAAAAPA